MSKSQKTVENQHRDDISSFEPRKIKREKNDHLEGQDISLTNNDQDHHQQIRLGTCGPRQSNGFHIGDILQDVITVKSLPNSPAVKNDKIRLMIEDSLNDDSKHKVQDVFLRVDQLKVEEKLLLYLKLPASLTNLGGVTDPLRQPLNPLGNRYEIHQTIMWIRTHLVEDPDVSLPKQEVYEEYNHFCTQNSMKPLSTADFGKVMKQVYPKVRPRRLGTRGNSRYCYAGMRKRLNLSTPTLPEITGVPEENEFDEPLSEKMLGAASILIREWAESVLDFKFPSLCALARYLVENFCVDTLSLSAICILSSTTSDVKPTTPKIPETPPSLSTTPVGGKSGKLRDAQLQLQKKLQQREHMQKDQVQNQQGKDKTDLIINSANNEKSTGIVKTKKTNKNNQVTNQSPQTIIIQNTPIKSQSLSTTPTIRSRKLNRSMSQISPQFNCDTTSSNNGSLSTKNNDDDNIIMKKDGKITTKNSRKRVSIDSTINSSEISPEKQAKLNDSNKNIEVLESKKKLSMVPSSTLKSKQDSEKNLDHKKTGKKINGTTNNQQLVNENHSSNLKKDEIKILRENSNIEKNDKLCTIDKDALDDYLNGGNNSQEPEEELLQYFQQSNSSSSDAEQTTVAIEDNQASRLDKVSQLRIILQQNLKGTTVRSTAVEPSTSALSNVTTTTTTTAASTTTTSTTSTTATTTTATATTTLQTILPSEMIQKHDIILPTILNNHNNAIINSSNSSRRRVSFETSVIDHSQDLNYAVNTLNTIPQSPNTRRRIFNFTPISPGPHSPINGRAASKPGSENASPFVSPRNTPVPRSRSNMAGVCRSRTQKQLLSRSTSCSAPYTGGSRRINNFVVPTSSTTQLSTSNCINKNSNSSCTVNVQTDGTNTTGSRLINEHDKKPLTCTSFLSSDIGNNEKQLVINYPSQENLQEIKSNHRRSQPADQEISELFNSVKTLDNEQYCRSQSVPLHRMLNPNFMSPISTSSFPSAYFDLSSSSSIAPTPVPSEYNDFGSTYLLDEVDANFIGDDQQFLMETKEISPENINKILNFLNEDDGKNINESLIDDAGLGILDTLPNSSDLTLPENILDSNTILNTSVSDTINKLIQSRSYPNTPLPPVTSTFPPAFTEDSNSSRSYPSTPLHTIQSQDIYRESNEPMLSSPTLNSLNLRSDTGHAGSAESVCRNVSDLLEPNFLADPSNDADDLNTLSNFDGLPDVDSLAPLFNEVSDANR